MNPLSRVEETQRVMLTIPEAARRLAIGRSTIYELLARGALESVHIGRSRRVPVDCLGDFVDACRREEQEHAR